MNKNNKCTQFTDIFFPTTSPFNFRYTSNLIFKPILSEESTIFLPFLIFSSLWTPWLPTDTALLSVPICSLYPFCRPPFSKLLEEKHLPDAVHYCQISMSIHKFNSTLNYRGIIQNLVCTRYFSWQSWMHVLRYGTYCPLKWCRLCEAYAWGYHMWHKIHTTAVLQQDSSHIPFWNNSEKPCSILQGISSINGSLHLGNWTLFIELGKRVSTCIGYANLAYKSTSIPLNRVRTKMWSWHLEAIQCKLCLVHIAVD